MKKAKDIVRKYTNENSGCAMQRQQTIADLIDELIITSSTCKKEGDNSFAQGILYAVGMMEGIQNDDNWNSVEDSLPEDGEEVLITYRGTDGKYYVHVDEYDHECGWSTGWDDDIVAWKPLPEPYCPERSRRT